MKTETETNGDRTEMGTRQQTRSRTETETEDGDGDKNEERSIEKREGTGRTRWKEQIRGERTKKQQHSQQVSR